MLYSPVRRRKEKDIRRSSVVLYQLLNKSQDFKVVLTFDSLRKYKFLNKAMNGDGMCT